ncbi:superfamily II DNA/RNA helicase [Evansella vedderi]|uniref:Superfamily II DNA/RNA helicase n=1 Tax=Evansella vedderi TaxID=38282 RepID=A0ABT9ZRZ6_9BACI|nr:DEAD/DEAH box helicase [Evansella vedderi]MDQ0254013.1 superfamily II DNA/RNA helicase [Evansella vedderi]
MSNTWSIIPSFQPFLQEGWQKSNFTNPTEIQEKAVPAILDGKDVIAESPTGTGKTLAYLLPVLNKVDVRKKEGQVLILGSSRELVMQILEEIRIWTEGSGIERTALIGGANVKRQLDKLKKKPQMIVGTPGRVVELLNMKKLKVHEVKTVVFDEGDQLFSKEHQKDVDHIIKSTLKERQILVFSATLSEEVEEKAKARMKDPDVIRVTTTQKVPETVEHVYVVCEERDKITTLRKLMNIGNLRALAFSNDINMLSTFAAKLEYNGMPLGVLHRDTTKQERETALKRFREGKYPLLLATDVAARGLDVKGLTHVVQLEVPKDEEQYIHRAGRTGRAGEAGTVVSIITEQEVKRLQKLAEKLGISLMKKKLYKGELK